MSHGMTPEQEFVQAQRTDAAIAASAVALTDLVGELASTVGDALGALESDRKHSAGDLRALREHVGQISARTAAIAFALERSANYPRAVVSASEAGLRGPGAAEDFFAERRPSQREEWPAFPPLDEKAPRLRDTPAGALFDRVTGGGGAR